jgi:hypothetical protein
MATVLGLNVKFAADTAGISKGAARTSKQLEGIGKSAASGASALKTLVAIEVGKLLAAGFTSAANAIGGFVSNVRATAGEIGKLAQVSNASVNGFQRIAFAAQTVGIEQDKMSDILKDVNDRIGDFMQTGGGPMADFFENIAPKVGVTAEQFARLSGPEALQLYVDSLEKAGLSQQEMTFYLEAMASDTTALIPLLQNGGAAMDGLADRAERLGVVLSEDQTSAIKQMNGALSQVHATFEGIIGQVTANLAPIVTSIAEEFLSFVEAFQGFGGEGGSGIADALTEGLLDFAEYMASIFDAVISQFLTFGETMAVVSAIFEFVANTFVAVSETLRLAFNLFEMVGNAIMIGLGKILEGLGSWVSSDLEQAGKEMVKIYSGAFAKNGAEAGDAFIHAVNASLGDRNFGREQTASDGMFGSAVAEARERFGRRGAAAAAAPETPQAMTAEQQYADKMQKLQQEMAENARKAEEERQKKLGDLNARYADESAKIEEDRLDKLAEVNQKALEATDIRSGGISQVLALATGREDPAVSEARAQRKELEKISRELAKLGGTVEIVGAA